MKLKPPKPKPTPMPAIDPHTRYHKEGPEPDIVPVPRTVFEEMQRKIEMLWQEHPRLWLMHKYGEELIPKTPLGEVILPDNADEAIRWPWRKVQQWYVRITGKDPGEQDTGIIRGNVVGGIKGWKHDRAITAAYHTPKPAPAPLPKIRLRLRAAPPAPKAHRVPNPD